MKSLKKLFCFSVLTIVALSCVSENEETRTFTELDTAEDLKCHKWFLDDKTLGVYDLFHTGAQPVSFVAKVRRRDNSVEFHHRAFNDGSLDEENTSKLFVDNDIEILGYYTASTKAQYMVALNPANENRIEFRDLPANKVQYQDPNGRGTIFATRIINSGKNFWMSFRQDDDDAKSFLSLYKRSDRPGGLGFEVKPIKKLSLDVDEDLLVNHGERLMIFQKTMKGDRVTVQYQSVDWSGAVTPAVELKIPVKNKIDSWSAVSFGDKLYVAFVDGDAFLRQGVLKVARFTVSGSVLKVDWFKGRSLMDVHTSQPIFQSHSKGLSVLVPKWLDDKSTLARYNVEDDGIVGVGHVGQFPKAARITDSYYLASEKRSYLTVRMKDNVAWQFSVCELE